MEKVLNYENIGNRIKKARSRKDITQQELSGIVNISVSHLSNIETGKTIASLEVMFQLANALEVSVDELLRDDISMDYSAEKYILHDCDEYERFVIREVMSCVKKSLREQKFINVNMK